MSRVKCKKDDYVPSLINELRRAFALQREKDKMLKRINNRLKVDYPFLIGFDLSNANGYYEYCQYMDCLMSGKVYYGID